MTTNTAIIIIINRYFEMLRYQIKTVTKARSVTKPKQGPNQSLLRQSVPESDRSPTVTSRDRGTTSSEEVYVLAA